MAPCHRVAAAGVHFAVEITGFGPPVLLLHGFPETRRSWRHTQDALAAAGHTVFAADLKGYGDSDKPVPGASHGDYRVSTLSRELGALIAALGHERMDVVGHDWGGILLSAMTHTAPARLGRIAILNAPYRWLAPWALRHVYRFNLPELPERRFWGDPTAFVSGLINTWAARPEVFGPSDLRHMVRSLQSDGSFTCAMAYYRSLRRDLPFLGAALMRRPPNPPPALVLFGAQDPIMPPPVARRAAKDLGGARLALLNGVGHFPQSESPTEVNRLLIEFLDPSAQDALPGA